jgi:hypothetical protein
VTVHTVHYTVDEANQLLPALSEMLLKLRDARDRLTDEQAREALSEAAPTNGGGSHGRHVGEAFVEMRALVDQFASGDIVLRDIDSGLVDFPTIREGREVYLCWQLGEDAVTHWHDLESGFGGRQPI